MATSKEQQKSTYPLPVYNFRVVVGEETMSFTEISGIVIEHNSLTYRHGLSYLEGQDIVTFYYEKFQPVTLKKGTVSGMTFLQDWLNDKESPQRAMQINLCDEEGKAVVTWHLGKVVPVKLTAPSFSVDANNLAIDTLEVMAANISVEHH